MGLQPDHHDVLTALLNLCNNAITECEAELEQQKASDMTEAKRLEEEQKVRENEAGMQKGPDNDKEDGEDEEGSESGVEEQPVRLSINIVSIFYTYSNHQICQDTSKMKTKCELEEDGRKKAPQTTHVMVSVRL